MGRERALKVMSPCLPDGRYKVQRAISEKIQFDERLQAAKALIDDCLRTWTENARPELSTPIDIFRVDQEGSIKAVAFSLRRLIFKILNG